MFKIIKKFQLDYFIFISMYLWECYLLTFINEGFVPLTDKNLQNLLIIIFFYYYFFFTLILETFIGSIIQKK